MALFIVRVELHGVDDYKPLHKAMGKAGFKQTLGVSPKSERRVTVCHLPDGEYSFQRKDIDSPDVVLLLAKKAAESVHSDYAAIVTKSGGIACANLKEVAITPRTTSSKKSATALRRPATRK